MKKILFISTGGTIASSKTSDGFKPYYNVDKLLESINTDMGSFEINGELLMNIDSSNMHPKHWIAIAKCIEENYENYDSFVVSHGTDTMAYTAAALTYMLQKLNKPIILTGAQHSIEETYTDAVQNLNDAVAFALENIAGVFVSFDGKLINGTRAIKVKTKSYNAFRSVNFPTVGNIKYGEIHFDENVIQHYFQQGTKVLEPNFQLCEDIFNIKLFPGINPKIFDFVKENYKGVIIESFGIGGVPLENYNLHNKIKELLDHNIAVVITTQCVEEGVDLNIYEVGKKLINNNIIFAGDMNTEAIVPKLMWALGQSNEIGVVKEIIETPIGHDIRKIL